MAIFVICIPGSGPSSAKQIQRCTLNLKYQQKQDRSLSLYYNCVFNLHPVGILWAICKDFKRNICFIYLFYSPMLAHVHDVDSSEISMPRGQQD